MTFSQSENEHRRINNFWKFVTLNVINGQLKLIKKKKTNALQNTWLTRQKAASMCLTAQFQTARDIRHPGQADFKESVEYFQDISYSNILLKWTQTDLLMFVWI